MIACAKCKFKCKRELVSQLRRPEYEDTISIDNCSDIKAQAEDSKEKKVSTVQVHQNKHFSTEVQV